MCLVARCPLGLRGVAVWNVFLIVKQHRERWEELVNGAVQATDRIRSQETHLQML